MKLLVIIVTSLRCWPNEIYLKRNDCIRKCTAIFITAIANVMGFLDVVCVFFSCVRCLSMIFRFVAHKGRLKSTKQKYTQPALSTLHIKLMHVENIHLQQLNIGAWFDQMKENECEFVHKKC